MSWFVCWSSEVSAVPVGSSGSTDCLRSGRRIGGVGFSWKHILLKAKQAVYGGLWLDFRVSPFRVLPFRVSPFRVQSKLQSLHTQRIAEVWLLELGCVARHHTSRPCKGRRWQEGHGFCGSQSHGNTVFNMITMSKCSIVHYLFACSADTGIFRNWLVGPRVFKCKSSWSAIKFYRNASKGASHCVRVAHRTDLRLAESS